MTTVPEQVRSAEELKSLSEWVAALPPTPSLLQRLIAVRDRSPAEFQDAVARLLEETVRRYQSTLTPQYHVVPWSELIMEDDDFREIYERTVAVIGDFASLDVGRVRGALAAYPRSLMVFRLTLGYTWDDLADVLNSKLGVALSKEKIRQLEQAEKLDDVRGKLPEGALDALAEAIDGIVCGRLMALPPDLDADRFRTRRQKLDTRNGWVSVAGCVEGGVTFGELLYERYTGRPFAYVRDALSEKKGDILEDALEALFRRESISFVRVTGNQAPGFEQAPDYLLPNMDNPTIAVEAKLAEDGGTARDKASRIERLKNTCRRRDILLMALVDGRGFRRFNDVMLPIVLNTEGHTFTLETLEEILLVDRVKALKGTK